MKEDNVVSKFIRFLQRYLLVGFPFVLVSVIWSGFNVDNQGLSTLNRFLWEILSWNLMAWFVVLISFLVLLVTSVNVREKTLRRLANLKDNDEREEYITGKAARTAYISSISVMVLLIFFSLFSFSVTRAPENTNGNHYNFNISATYQLLNSSGNEQNAENVIFDSKNYSLSPTSIILVLLGWQLLSFNLSARKEFKRN